MVDVPALLKHARRYGVEGVAEAAVDLHFGVEDLTELIEGLDKIEADVQRSKRFGTPVRRRLTPKTRAERMLGIEPQSKEDE